MTSLCSHVQLEHLFSHWPLQTFRKKEEISPKPFRLCRPRQQDVIQHLQSRQWVFHVTVGECWPTHLCFLAETLEGWWVWKAFFPCFQTLLFVFIWVINILYLSPLGGLWWCIVMEICHVHFLSVFIFRLRLSHFASQFKDSHVMLDFIKSSSERARASSGL